MSQYDIIEHMSEVQQELLTKANDEEKIVFVTEILDYLVSRDKTLNTDIGDALSKFILTLSQPVAKEIWVRCLERKRIKKALWPLQENVEFSSFIKSLFLK
mgnify:CR=1 FL=1